MAHVYGKPGGFAKEEYTRRMLRYFCIVYAVVIVAGAAIGFVCGLGQKGGVISLYCLVGFIVFTLLAWLVLVPRFERFLDRRAKEASNWKAGYTGEAQVANLLEDLPDDFHVFHDVKHRDLAGNIDHLVVGPTGVFVLETKNWRGHVEYSPDKKLLNDGRDKTAEMNALLQRVFSVRDKIKALSGLDVYVKGVMVFTRASVSPSFDATIALHQDDYLVDKCLKWDNKEHHLSKANVDTVAADLRALFRRELG